MFWDSVFMNSLSALLASLLASAHGFGSIPVNEDCFREGVNEKFFVYSTDHTQMFAVAEAEGGISIPLNVTHGVVGKIWQGMELSITQGNTSITAAGGKPLTMTSPNSPGTLTYMSEDFCLPYGNWTVKMNVNTTLNPLFEEDFFTSNETTRQYAPMWWEKVTYPPLLSVGETQFGLIVINGTLHNGPDGGPVSPFRLSWGIFPAAMREEAEAARTALDGGFGLNFVLYGSQNYRWLKTLAFGDMGMFKYDVQAERWMDVEKLVQVVPVPNQMCWADDRIWSGPCPRPEGWGEGGSGD